MKKILAPKHLSVEGKKLWRGILTEYEIEDCGGLAILTTAIEAYDRMKQAQKEIDDDGMSITDRWGQTKVHPLCSVERDARSQFLAALKMLNLDLEPLKNVGRPGGN